MFRIEIDWSPAYELVASIKAFAGRTEHRTLELGPAWITEVRRHVDADLIKEVSARNALCQIDAIDLLIQQCPVERDAANFLAWLRGLSGSELYKLLEPHIIHDRGELLGDLDSLRDRYVRLLAAWNEQYFRHVDPEILAGLAADAAAKQELAGSIPTSQLLGLATSGVIFADEDSDETILLVPQYHYRPWNLFAEYRGQRTVEYPCDALPPAPGEPPPGLVRTVRALSDPNRLRMLRFLCQAPRTFTDLVQYSGLSKSTVHHHLVILRAAGLILVPDLTRKGEKYVPRTGNIDSLGERLSAYLREDSASEETAN